MKKVRKLFATCNSDGSSASGGSSIPYRRFPWVISTALFFAVALTGCESATVYVGHPQVFTRERLVISRQQELQFLTKQLDAGNASGFQGAIDERSISAFQSALSATISPTPAPTSQPTSMVNLGNLVLPAPTTQAVASNVTMSGIDRLQDQMAYRDAVNAVMREKELDDTHDLLGHTLYTLKFDCSLLPGQEQQKPALVLLRLMSGATLDDNAKLRLYKDWLQYLDHRLLKDKIELTDRMVRNGWDYSDASYIGSHIFRGVDQFKRSIPQDDETARDAADSALQKTYEFVANLNPQSSGLLHAPPEIAVQVYKGFWLSLDQQYREEFPEVISIVYIKVPGGGYESHIADPGGHQDPKQCPLAFLNALMISAPSTKLKGDLYVDSVDPQEYAQNLSDVSTNSRLLSLSLAISALIGNSASANSTSQYLSQSQALLQSIRRNPLSVSFHSGQNFGWVLGSPFQIKNTEVTFTHQPVDRSFSVSIVAPLWLGAVDISSEAWWVRDSGAKGGKIDIKNGAHHHVILPRDFEAITSAIRFQNGGIRGPTIALPYTPWELTSKSTDEQTVLIFGTELWRNPQVFIGSQRADTVDILPNMRGVLAHFKTIPVVQKDTSENLTVVTSFGRDTVQAKVLIHAPPSNTQAAPTASIAVPYLVAGATTPPLKFAIDLNSLPTNYAGFMLRLRPVNSSIEWISEDTVPVTRSTDKRTLSFQIPSTDQIKSPTLVMVDFRLKPNLFDDPINLLAKLDPSERRVMFFPAQDQEKPRLLAQKITFTHQGPSSPSLSLTMADSTVTWQNLYDAYPGLENSIKSGTAILTLKASSATPIELPLAPDTTQWSIQLTGVTAKQLPAGSYDTATLTYKSSSSQMAVIPVLLSPVTAGGSTQKTIDVLWP